MTTYQSISTKVSAEARMKLLKICKKKGITMYDFLQMVCDTIIRYMDPMHNLDDELEQAMSIFEHMHGWQDSFNLVEPKMKGDISQATYYLTCENKKGVRAVHVSRPFFNNWTATNNVVTILEQTICHLFPELYRQCRVVGKDLGTNNIVETIRQLIIEHMKERDREEFRQPFEDADRGDFGQKPSDQRFVQKRNRDIDSPGLFD